MKVLSLIAQELRHRRLNALLALGGLATTVALTVLFVTVGSASKRETARLMRDLGYNLRIIAKDADLEQFWLQGYADATLPADGVQRFATESDVAYNHLIAMLQRRVDWGGRPVVLTGIALEVSPKGKKTGTMLFEVESGTVHVGAEPARRLGLEVGKTCELLGETFTVAAVLAPAGTEDDVRVWLDLGDAQRLLGLPGQVNEIKALECYCATPGDARVRLREELERILPEGQVIRIEPMAIARRKQREMADDYFGLVLPLVLIACAAWIAFLATLNVRERREEIGILRALGHTTQRIAALFLGRAAVLGALGAAFGFAAGSAVAVWFGPSVFEATASSLGVDWWLLPVALLMTPLFAGVSSLVPTGLAVTQDPAETLRGPR